LRPMKFRGGSGSATGSRFIVTAGMPTRSSVSVGVAPTQGIRVSGVLAPRRECWRFGTAFGVGERRWLTTRNLQPPHVSEQRMPLKEPTDGRSESRRATSTHWRAAVNDTRTGARVLRPPSALHRLEVDFISDRFAPGWFAPTITPHLNQPYGCFRPHHGPGDGTQRGRIAPRRWCRNGQKLASECPSRIDSARATIHP
jgi:hypothetical protein